MLDAIQTGRVTAPPRILVYGIEGIGKSTLAASAPKPIFIQTEDGLGNLDVARFPLAASYADVRRALAALATEEHGYQTCVIDSIDWLERLIWDEVCRSSNVDSIERAAGGYGKGYVLALTQWRAVIDALNALRARGMATVLIAHAQVEKFVDPEVGEFDRYSPRLHKRASALVVEWCDVVGFATRKLRISEIEAGGFARVTKLAKAVGPDGGDRILRCVGSPACLAKNRYGLPAELPLEWAALMAGLMKES